jgi:hypothetical protein
MMVTMLLGQLQYNFRLPSVNWAAPAHGGYVRAVQSVSRFFMVGTVFIAGSAWTCIISAKARLTNLGRCAARENFESNLVGFLASLIHVVASPLECIGELTSGSGLLQSFARKVDPRWHARICDVGKARESKVQYRLDEVEGSIEDAGHCCAIATG